MARTSDFVDIEGPVHYIDHGGNGPTMVMVHGLGGSHLNWRRIAPLLTGRYRVLALDLRGFGLTPLDGHDARLATQVSLVAEFISNMASEPVILVGNSMGGLVSLLTTAEHPELVAGLVMINPALPIRSSSAINRDTVLRLGLPLVPGLGEMAVRHYETSASPEQRITESFQYITADPDRIDPETLQASIEMARVRLAMEWSDKAFAQAMRSIAAVLLPVGRFRRTLHSVGAPTLLIHGQEDRVVPPQSAEWLAMERPDWEFHSIEDVGHVPQLELPHVVVSLIMESQAASSLLDEAMHDGGTLAPERESA